MTYRIAIVGGGITGLTTAYRLMSKQKQNNNLPCEITLIESSNRLGGVIKSQAIDNFIIEAGPDAFLHEKPALKNLLSELNLDKELLFTNELNRKAFIAKGNDLIPLPYGFFMIAPTNWFTFFTSPLFSQVAKLRVVLEPLIPAKEGLTDESVSQFLRRRFGQELVHKIGQPIVGGIYMADIDLLSAYATLPQFVELENKYGSIIRGLIKTGDQRANTASGARYNLFSSLKQGTQMLIDRLANCLTNVDIHLNTTLTEINSGKNKAWQVSTNNDTFEVDAIVLAIPAQIAAQAIDNLDKSLSNTLKSLENSSSVVINLLYKQSAICRPYKGFGFIVPKIENRKIIAASFISQKFTLRSQDGHEMIRVFLGGQIAPTLFDLEDKELLDIAQNELSHYLDIKTPPVRSWLSRWKHGLPFYKVGHRQQIEKIKTLASHHSGLFLAGSSYNGIGIPDCVADGEKVAASIIQFLQQREIQCLKEA